MAKRMTAATVAALALALPESTEEQPFGDQVDVYKVRGKIFAILSADSKPPSVSLKCDPELALQLRAEYDGVTAGYHLNKKHWNTVVLDGTIPAEEIEDMVAHSWERVVMGFPKLDRARLLAN